MPTLICNSTFKLKVFEFESSILNFYFKINTTFFVNNVFDFKHANFGRYLSLVMLEYYLSSKNFSANTAVEEYILNSIKNDLGKDGFVVVLKESDKDITTTVNSLVFNDILPYTRKSNLNLKVSKTQEHIKKTTKNLLNHNLNTGDTTEIKKLSVTSFNMSDMVRRNDLLITELKSFLLERASDLSIVNVLISSIRRINNMALHKYKFSDYENKLLKVRVGKLFNAKMEKLQKDMFLSTRMLMTKISKQNEIKLSFANTAIREINLKNKLTYHSSFFSNRSTLNRLVKDYSRSVAERSSFYNTKVYLSKSINAKREKGNRLNISAFSVTSEYFSDKNLRLSNFFLGKRSEDNFLNKQTFSILSKRKNNIIIKNVNSIKGIIKKNKGLKIDSTMFVSILKQRIYKSTLSKIMKASYAQQIKPKIHSFDFISERITYKKTKANKLIFSMKEEKRKTKADSENVLAKYNNFKKVYFDKHKYLSNKNIYINLYNVLNLKSDRVLEKKIKKEKIELSKKILNKRLNTFDSITSIRTSANVKTLLQKINYISKYSMENRLNFSSILSMNYYNSMNLNLTQNSLFSKQIEKEVLISKIVGLNYSTKKPFYFSHSVLSDKNVFKLLENATIKNSTYSKEKEVILANQLYTTGYNFRELISEKGIDSSILFNKSIFIQKEIRGIEELKAGELNEEQFFFETLPTVSEVIIKTIFADYSNSSIALIDSFIVEAVKNKKEFNYLEQKFFVKNYQSDAMMENFIISEVVAKSTELLHFEIANKIKLVPSIITTLQLLGIPFSKKGKLEESLLFDKYMQGYLHEVLIGDLVIERYAKFLENILLDKKLPAPSVIEKDFMYSAKERLSAVKDILNLSEYAVLNNLKGDLITETLESNKEKENGTFIESLTSVLVLKEAFKYNIINYATLSNRESVEEKDSNYALLDSAEAFISIYNGSTDGSNSLASATQRESNEVVNMLTSSNPDKLSTMINFILSSRDVAKSELAESFISTVTFRKGNLTSLLSSDIKDRIGEQVIELLDAQVIDSFAEYLSNTVNAFNTSAEGVISTVLKGDLKNRLADQVMLVGATRFDIFGDDLLAIADAYRTIFEGNINKIINGERKVGKGEVEENVVQSEKIVDFATTIFLSLGLVDLRSSDNLSNSLSGINPDKLADYLDGSLLGKYTNSEGLEIKGFSADFKNHLAVHLLNTVFSADVDSRIGSMVSMYESATRLNFEGELEFDLWRKFADLLVKQGILGEGMLGKDFIGTANLLENIIATVAFNKGISLEGLFDSYKEENESLLDSQDINAFVEAVSSIMRKDDNFAIKEDKIINLLDHVVSDKQLTISLLSDVYDWALRDNLNESYNNEDHIFSAKELKDSLIDTDSKVAQGLIYNYDDIIIDRKSDPEFWEGGYFVPIDYDPSDPFNLYYPYAVEQSEVMLSEYGWTEIESITKPAEWVTNESFSEFNCVNPSDDLTGFYLNNFDYDSYSFDVDIVTDDVDDEGVGVIVNYKDSTNYYYFMVSGGDSKRLLDMPQVMQLYRVYNGVSFSYGSPLSPSEWINGQTLRFNVLFNNSNLKVKVNGILQYDINLD